MQHREVPVKVNAFVDEGIAGLISALAEIDGLVTVESCQGGEQNGFVIFRYGDWEKTGRFLFDRLLPALSPDLRASVSLSLQAFDTDMALGKIWVEPGAISELVGVVVGLARQDGPPCE